MPKTGHFVLHSNFKPQLTAGRYELLSTQTGLPFTVAPETTHVHVAAPRYTMPTEQILSSFPPANAEGAFSDRLPQIVLKRRTLPWERNPAGQPVTSDTPWLALVVVAEGEAELSTAAPVKDCVTPGTTLLDADDRDVEQGLYLSVTETVVKKIFPTEQDLPLLAHVRQVDVDDTELANGDDDGWLAVVLANRLPVYDQANGRPVRYMACLVNVEGQLAALPKPPPPIDKFVWERAQDWRGLAALGSAAGADALVAGNAALQNVAFAQGLRAAPRDGLAPGTLAAASVTRVAGALDGAQSLGAQQAVGDQWRSATGQIAAAALDPDAKRLVRDTMGLGFRLPIGLYALEKVLRFPVLAHWSFTTTTETTFESLMQGLDVGLLGTLPPERTAKDGAPPAPPRAGTPTEVVATGHVGLAHRARRGDAVRAWYRGPCVPFATRRSGGSEDGPLPLAHSADQLRRSIPDGREDLTLAAAFEIGRLLALSQLSVVSALLRFRGEQFGAGRVRELLDALVPFALPKPASNAQGLDLGRFVAVQLVDALAKNPERMLGPRRPLADAGREIDRRADLDRVVATGLGLDADELRRRGAEIGTLAALRATAVPVAGTMGGTKVGERERVLLSAALDNELQRTLAVALPTRIVRRGRAPAAAAPRDALDELIERAPADDDDIEEDAS
ncbi:hypothetical protein [Caldimonas sp. KR1-144]|uniref:hypothetical protein n=1 Tax=Caldimonas sp. KR1-144 TaxID=3400911 RepID=UPI003C030DA0